MGINFVPGQYLKASDLNTAFATTLDLSQTAPQQMSGALNAPSVNASISLSTQDLTATGNVFLTSIGALQLPGGNSLQRPNSSTFGMIRFNTDSGLLECRLSNGQWANFVTSAATQSQVNPPINQSGVQFGQASATAIPLAWTPPLGGTSPFSYTVQYRLTGTSNWTTWAANLLNTLTTTVSGLLPATRYDFQVMSFNTAGNATSPISSTNTLGFASGGPTNITAFSPTSTTMSISWTAVASTVPVAYVVQYAAFGQGIWAQSAPLNETVVTIAGLIPNTGYNFQVIAKTTGASYDSTVIAAQTAATATVAPNAPTAVLVSSVTFSSANISWTPPTSGTAPFAYQVQLQLNALPFFDYKTPTTASSLTLLGLNSGGSYNVRVKAINSAGNAVSASVPLTPNPATATTGTVAGFQSSGSTYPIISGPMVGTIGIGNTLDLDGLFVNDPSSAFSPGSLSIAVSCGGGTVTLNDPLGNKIVGSGTNSIPAVAMTLGAVLNSLSTLSYTAPLIPTTDAVLIKITDQFAQTSTLTIAISILGGSTTPTPTPTPAPPGGGGSGGLVTPTGQPTDATGSQASFATYLLASMGVGVAFESPSYGNFSPNSAAIVENQINYITAGNPILIRAKIGALFTGVNEQQYLAMVAQNSGNSRFLLSLDINSLPTFQWQGILDSINSFVQNFPGYLDGIQGVINAGGSTGNATQISQAEAFQQNVFVAANNLGLPAYALSTTNGVPPTSAASEANVGFMQVQPQFAPDMGGNPGTFFGTINQALSTSFGTQYASSEFGYNIFPDGGGPIPINNWITETAAASYMLIYYFKNYSISTYQWPFTAINSTGNAIWSDLIDDGNQRGLFNDSGSPRLAARALRATYQLMFDSSINSANFFPGVLNYSVTGKPAFPTGNPNAGYGETLIQDAGGVFTLIMWNEQQLNQTSGNQLISVAPVNVTITFNERSMTQVSVYDPLLAFSGFMPTPVQTATNVTQITVSLPAHPILLKIRH